MGEGECQADAFSKIYVTGSVCVAVALSCVLSKFYIDAYIDATVNAKTKHIQNNGANEGQTNSLVNSNGCSVDTKDIHGNVVDMSLEDFKLIYDFLNRLDNINQSFEKLDVFIQNKDFKPAEKRKYALQWYHQVLNELNSAICFLTKFSTLMEYKFTMAGLIEKLLTARANLKKNGVIVSGENVVDAVDSISFLLKELGYDGRGENKEKEKKGYWSEIMASGGTVVLSALVAAAVTAARSGKNQ